MRYVKQFLIIIAVSLIGELLEHFVPLPVPASIYGMILMFIGLMTGIIPYESVKDTAKFLVDIMPVMFVPACVGILGVWDIVKGSILKYIVAVVITTVVVMAVSGLSAQFVIRRRGGEKDE